MARIVVSAALIASDRETPTHDVEPSWLYLCVLI
jgi:hypothetical protein